MGNFFHSVRNIVSKLAFSCLGLWLPLCPCGCAQSQKKTQSSVFDSPRAMGKLLKEAKRVKQVLSANTEHFAQVCMYACM